MKLHPRLPYLAAFVGVATGLALGKAWPSEQFRAAMPDVTEMHAPSTPDPLRGFTRAETMVAMEEARAELEAGRPWAAWTVLRGRIGDPADAYPGAVLLGARAAAAWGGWPEVRELLRGRDWLDRLDGGEGWWLLGRAEEAGENWPRAAEAFRRSAARSSGEARGAANARLGTALRRAGDPRGAAAAYAAAASGLPDAREWMTALQAEALAAAGDAEALRVAAIPGGTPASRARQARAEAAFRSARGDAAGAAARLEAEAAAIAAEAGPTAARLRLESGRVLEGVGRTAEAREAFRRVAADAQAEKADRLAAAAALGKHAGGLGAAEELARAAAYEAGGKPGLAAKSLRGALSAGAADDAATRLRIGRLLFDEADFGPARAALLVAAERQTDAEAAAEAELYAARALYRRDAGAGLAEMKALAERRAGTAAAGTALFLLGDAASSIEAGISYYRRAASVAHSPSAREALFRLGDRALKAGDDGTAVRAWREYLTRWPRGEASARVAYRAGVHQERAGREDEARAMYAAAIAAEPVSYHAVRAGDRAGADPLERALHEPGAWPQAPADAAEAGAVLRRLDALEAAGLEDAWKEELAVQARRLERRPAALLLVGEGLRDRVRPVEGIRVGRRLVELRAGVWDARLLRLVFPLPYREVLTREAERAKVDPWLLAGLVRQESSFDAAARSRVGARGLGQIMPSTAEWMAGPLGMEGFQVRHLAVPEVNLRLGSRYLRDQVRRYDGARDLALAAYNAGPGRADRWRRELGHGGDPDRFREAIPFPETREYVQVVLRNAVIYRRLYGPARSPGLSASGD